MRKFGRDDQRVLAAWALDCAEHVLTFFEQARPDDARPRVAIEVGRAWVHSGRFGMQVIRAASLAAHAAARSTTDAAAVAAARAAGQAVATAHVVQHAYGGAYYALKAILAADPERAPAAVQREQAWQRARLPEPLRDEVMGRILVAHVRGGLRVVLRKDAGF